MSTIDAITYHGCEAVTQSDSADDPAGPFAGLFTGTGGAIKVTMVDGTVFAYTNLPAGVFLNAAVRRVWSTGTGATGIGGTHSPLFPKRIA